MEKVKNKQRPTRFAESLSSFGRIIADSYRAVMNTENIILMLKYNPNMPNSCGEKMRVRIGAIKKGISWEINVPVDKMKTFPDTILLNGRFKIFFFGDYIILENEKH